MLARKESYPQRSEVDILAVIESRRKFSKESLDKLMVFLRNVVKGHRIKYQELICPRAYRNCNNLLWSWQR